MGSVGVLTNIIKWVLAAGTDIAFVPALTIVYANGRHFEVFIGVLQLISSFLYNTTEVLGASIFLKHYQWHHISDVTSLTYVCLLAIQFMQIPNSDTNTSLRYAAFSLCWVAKFKDGWESGYAQGAVLTAFIVAALVRIALGHAPIAGVHQMEAKYGVGLLLLAGLCLAIETSFGDTQIDLFLACGHVSAGASVYFLWKACPCMDMKRDERQPSFV